MTTKKKILIAISVLLSTGLVFAEDPPPTTNSVTFIQDGDTNAGNVLQHSERNSLTVNQLGLSGFVDILQGQEDLADIGNENFLVLNQGGTENSVTLRQLGNLGKIEAVQEGQGNSIEFSDSGTRNSATFTQTGIGNFIQGDQFGKDNSVTINQQRNGDSAIFTQLANNNTLVINQTNAR